MNEENEKEFLPEADRRLWDKMGELPVPEPSAKMEVRFQAMLETFRANQAEKRNPLSRIIQQFRHLFTGQPGFAWTYSLLLVAVGIGLGLLSVRPAPVRTDRSQIETLSGQVHELREMVMLSLLQNPSASERMKGVSYTSEIKTVNREVTEALLTTLNEDPNINVRLMTLEALTHIAGNPEVREGLVHSILRQDSPLVQAALADVMLKLQEKRSIPSFKKLLQQKDLNDMVRSKIEQTITRLI